MTKNKIRAIHPVNGERLFSAGIWAALGPDKAGYKELPDMPEELKNKAANAELRRMAEAGEINATTGEQVAEVMETALKRSRKRKDV